MARAAGATACVPAALVTVPSLGPVVELHTNDLNLANHLRDAFGAPAGTQAIAVAEFERRLHPWPRWVTRMNGVTDPNESGRSLPEQVDHVVATAVASRGFTVLRGSVVRSASATVLVTSADEGRTATVVRSALAAGCQYVGHPWVAIDHDGAVLPLGQPMVMFPWDPLWTALPASHTEDPTSNGQLVPISALGWQPPDHKVGVDLAVDVSIHVDGQPRLEPARQVELALQLFTTARYSPSLEAIGELVGRARCARLVADHDLLGEAWPIVAEELG